MTSWFRASREKRGPDPFLAAKVAIFCAGAAVALLGMALNKSWVISVAIGILLVGFILRFLPRQQPGDSEETKAD
jgi:hypothetical protein